MKLSELIEEFIDMKSEGPPENNGWQSIEDVAHARTQHEDRLRELRDAIDAHGITGEKK